MHIEVLQNSYFHPTDNTKHKLSVSTDIQSYRDYFDAVAARLNQTNTKDKPTLSQEQLRQLKEKYGSGEMTYDRYQSFLDDLVSMGALTTEDKYRIGGVLQAGEFRLTPVAFTNNYAIMPADPRGTASPMPFHLMEQEDTNIADWLKFRAALDACYFDSKGSKHDDNVKDIFAYVSKILSDMQQVL